MDYIRAAIAFKGHNVLARNGSTYELLVDTWDDRDGVIPSKAGLLALETTFSSEDVSESISIEAERRIDAGTTIGGNLIRCDDRSVLRLHGMLKKAERLEAQSKPVSLKFKTKTGATVIIDSAAAAGAVYDGISDHVAFILGRSADLQDLAPEQLADLDPSLDAHWME